MVSGLSKDGQNPGLVALHGPAAVFLAGQAMVSVADMAFVGRLDPAAATAGQAAVVMGILTVWTLAALIVPIGFRTGSLAAFHHRRSDGAGLNKVLFNGLVMVTVLAVAAASAGWFLVPPLFDFLAPTEPIAESGISYARWRLLGLPAFAAVIVFRGVWEAVGDVGLTLWICGLMNAVNIAFNGLLLFDVGVLPALSVEAAAVASLLSVIAGAAAMTAWSLRPDWRHRWVRARLFDVGLCWRLLSRSSAAAVGGAAVLASFAAALRVVGLADQMAQLRAVDALRHSQIIVVGLTDWLSTAPNWPGRSLVDDWAHSLAMSRPPVFWVAAAVIGMTLSPAIAVAVAAANGLMTHLRTAVDAGHYDRAEKICWKTVIIAMTAVGAVAVVVIVFPTAVVGLFSVDVAVVAAAVPALRLTAAQLPLITIAIVLWGAHVGVAQSPFATIVAVVYGLAVVPGTYLFSLAFDLGFMGIWWAVALITAIAAVTLAINFWLGTWKPRDNP